ncbi:MAG: aspartyl protease family protein [Myxococcales bacterium]|nr:aspartyl protease family protein [Myxococcales bacterium]
MRKLLAALLASACVAPRPAPHRADLLACLSDALGGRERLAALRTVRREATIESGGLTGVARTWSRADGALREEERLGPATSLSVYDGRRGWDREGLAPVVELSHLELARMRTRAWLASFGPFLRAGGTARPGPRENTLLIAAPEGYETLFELDPKTCLPRKQERFFGPETVTSTFVRWASAGGVQFPQEIEDVSSRSPEDVTRVRFTATEVDAPADPALFAKPPLDRRMTVPRLDAPVAIPFELTQNHIYIQAGIDGKGPVALLVDTGANSLILDKARADQLDLRGEGKLKVYGSGSGSLDSRIIPLPTIDLGPLHMPVESARIAALTALSHREGRPMEGIFGFETIGHFVTEFDYAGGMLRLHDAATFRPPADAVELPFYFNDTKPIVRGEIELGDGRRLPLDIQVDTGSRSALDFTASFVRQNRLLEGKGPFLRAPLGFGIGGQTKEALGRVVAVHLGSVAVGNVLCGFSEDELGSMAGGDEFDANLGSGLMKQLTVWVDYPRQRMLIAPNAHFGEPIEYDMSGLLFESPDDSYRRAVVRNVLPGSPGAQAGLEKDDEVISAGGRSVSEMRLDDLRAMFRKPGEHVHLEVRRGARSMTVEVVTRRLI